MRKLFRTKAFRVVVVLVLLLVLIAVAVKILYPKFYAAAVPTRRGVVTEVDYRPNMAEDGHYAFTVKDTKNDKEYRVEATGYMNTPLPPSQNGESCVDIPSPEAIRGATVEFKLPDSKLATSIDIFGYSTSGSYGKVYETCYKAIEEGAYFFRIIR